MSMALRVQYFLIAICFVFNSAIAVYGAKTSSYKLPKLSEELEFIFYTSIIPAFLMLIAAYGRKNISPILLVCILVTCISGMFFLVLYEGSRDPSRIFYLGIHWLITYLFALISLISIKSKST